MGQAKQDLINKEFVESLGRGEFNDELSIYTPEYEPEPLKKFAPIKQLEQVEVIIDRLYDYVDYNLQETLLDDIGCRLVSIKTKLNFLIKKVNSKYE
jgi:hypothetical protein